MIKKTKVVLIIIILVVVASLAYYFLAKNKRQPPCWPYCPGMTDQDRARIKEEMREAGCPDEMIVDKMPSAVDDRDAISSRPKAYYIKDSKRVEITEYDPIWLNANCEIPVKEVW